MEPVGRQRNSVLILARSFAAELATTVFLVDAEGTVIYFNETAERLLGQRFIEGAGMRPRSGRRGTGPRTPRATPAHSSLCPWVSRC